MGVCLKLDLQGVALSISSSLLPEKVLRRYKLHRAFPFVSSPGNHSFFPSKTPLRSGEIHFLCAAKAGETRGGVYFKGWVEGFEIALFLFTALTLSP